MIKNNNTEKNLNGNQNFFFLERKNFVDGPRSEECRIISD